MLWFIDASLVRLVFCGSIPLTSSTLATEHGSLHSSFLTKRFWGGLFGSSARKTRKLTKEMQMAVPDVVNENSKAATGNSWDRPHDVEAEHARVVSNMLSREKTTRIAVAGLHKVFGSAKLQKSCCEVRKFWSQRRRMHGCSRPQWCGEDNNN